MQGPLFVVTFQVCSQWILPCLTSSNIATNIIYSKYTTALRTIYQLTSNSCDQYEIGHISSWHEPHIINHEKEFQIHGRNKKIKTYIPSKRNSIFVDVEAFQCIYSIAVLILN